MWEKAKLLEVCTCLCSVARPAFLEPDPEEPASSRLAPFIQTWPSSLSDLESWKVSNKTCYYMKCVQNAKLLKISVSSHSCKDGNSAAMVGMSVLRGQEHELTTWHLQTGFVSPSYQQQPPAGFPGWPSGRGLEINIKVGEKQVLLG